MADSDKSNLKVSVNGKELSGENAKEYAEKLTKNLSETLNGLLTDKLGKMTSNPMSGNLLNAIKPLNNLSGLLKQNSNGAPSGSPGIQNMIPHLSKMLPVLETSDDNKQIKLSLNGVPLLDLDLSNLSNNESSKEE